ADAYVLDQGVLLGNSAADEEVSVVGEPFVDDPYGIGIPQDSEDALEFCNTFLQEIIDSGAWEALWTATIGGVMDGAAPEPPTPGVSPAAPAAPVGHAPFPDSSPADRPDRRPSATATGAGPSTVRHGDGAGPLAPGGWSAGHRGARLRPPRDRPSPAAPRGPHGSHLREHPAAARGHRHHDRADD